MGIRLVVGSAYSLDMSDYDFTGIGDAEITKFTSTKITGTAGQFKLAVTGHGFEHDNQGYLTDGSVSSLKLTYHGQNILSLTGAHVSIEKLISVINTASAGDDLALLKKTLDGSDYLSGSRYGDLIRGYGGDDILIGKGGSDRIDGGVGADRIVGGAGTDHLWGGKGDDIFAFTSASDSKAKGADTIHDFSNADDRIDLHDIDANGAKAGNAAFDWIGGADFHHKAGELRFETIKNATYIQGDLDGDGTADFAIHLQGAFTLKAHDFAL